MKARSKNETKLIEQLQFILREGHRAERNCFRVIIPGFFREVKRRQRLQKEGAR